MQAGHLGVRLDAGPGLCLAQAVAQQHGPQPGLPGVAFQPLGQVQAVALAGVQAPADVGTLHPAADQWQVRLVQPEPGAQAGHFQQAQDLAGTKAAAGQGQ